MRLALSKTVAALAAAVALALIAASPAAAVEGPTSAEIRTPLHQLGAGKTFVIRAVETSPSGPAVTLVATFFDAQDHVVKTQTAVVTPGHPATFRLTRADLHTDETAPAARASVLVRRAEGFAENQLIVNFDLVDRQGSDGCGGLCSFCSREGFSCASNDPGHAPSVVCEGPVVLFTTEQ
jgi:hypothetical protein